MSFTHLNVSSAYSFHFGTAKPEKLTQAAASFGQDALAITDMNGLYGAVKHIGSCLDKNISPIVGVRLEVQNRGVVTILARGHNKGTGWAALCKIVSKAQSKSKKEIAITEKDLSELIATDGKPNCTILLGPDSDFGRAVIDSNATVSAKKLLAWQELIPVSECLSVEIVSHLTEPGTNYSTLQAKRMLQLAITLGVRAVITNAVRYLEPDDALTGDVLDAARHLEPLGIFTPQPNAQAWLKPESLMKKLAIEITQSQELAATLLKNTEELANSLRLDPVSDCDWSRPKTPEKSALGIESSVTRLPP